MLTGLRGWLAARPWRARPMFCDGWSYPAVYRACRDGSRHPRTGAWVAGGEPQSRPRALWSAVSFPHTHTGEQ